MFDELDFSLDVDADDVDADPEYSGYEITHLNVNTAKKEIVSVHYTYSWHCGDYCCSDTEHDSCGSGALSQWVKDSILKKYPEYTFAA